MHLRVPHIAILLSALLLSACVGVVPPHEALPADAQDKIASADVVLPIHQSEIYVFVPNSNVSAAAGGGLLAALVDAGINDVRTGKAETAVKPLRDALVDYNFDASLQGKVKDSLSQMTWLHADDFRVLKDNTNDSMDAVLAGSKDSAVLFVTADYRLANDGDVLDITSTASLFPKDEALKALKKGAPASGPNTALANSLYHNTFTFEFKLPGTMVDNRDANIALWSANNGAAMRAALDTGAEQLAQMVAADLQGEARPPANAVQMIGEISTLQGPIDQSGRVVSSDSNGQLLRFDDGTMKYTQVVAP